VEIKDEIKLAHVAEVTVKNLNEVMDRLQMDQFIVIVINEANKRQRSISLVYKLAITPLNEVALS
jgi:hypothetical protein